MLINKGILRLFIFYLFIVLSSCIDDAVFLNNADNGVIVPSDERLDYRRNRILVEKQSITLMQWNIGHFSNGSIPISCIQESDYEEKLVQYRKLIKSCNADIIALSEYSVLFANTSNHPYERSDTLLFPNYNRYIGNNELARHYSLNAVFYKINNLGDFETVEYVVNQDAKITHSSAIKAKDYYYTTSHFTYHDRDIVLITTHLAFDSNNPEVAINQIKELIEICQSYNYIIICGDFNTQGSSYSLFEAAGYSLANKGYIWTYPSSSPSMPLDNIIVKGFTIDKVRTIDTRLSDHIPILCNVSLADE